MQSSDPCAGRQRLPGAWRVGVSLRLLRPAAAETVARIMDCPRRVADCVLTHGVRVLLLLPCYCAVQVHTRWLNLWARRIMASPEQALVPLKERDALLASKHEVRDGHARTPAGGNRHTSATCCVRSSHSSAGSITQC